MVIVTQFAWTFASAVVAGFGAALGWRKGSQAAEVLDRASSVVSASIKQSIDRTVGKLLGQPGDPEMEATASGS